MWNRISMFGQFINKIGKITNFGLKGVKGFMEEGRTPRPPNFSGSILTTTTILTLFSHYREKAFVARS